MEFNFITNPENGHNISIFSKEGRRVLGNYVYVNKQLGGKLTKKRKARGRTAYCKISKERTPRNSKDNMTRCRRSRGRRNKRCKRTKRGQCSKKHHHHKGGKRSRSRSKGRKRRSRKRSSKKGRRSFSKYFS
tara:strand:- start:1450 stop:1845 length:396 start_codon:yes stop_codon:yes gene_type:complete